MKVGKLYIIEILVPPLDEVENSAMALNERYQANLVLSLTPPSTPSGSNWKEVISKSSTLSEMSQMIRKDTDADQNITGGVGLYIVSHGSGSRIGGITGQQMADLIDILGFGQIRKICLVACNVAGEGRAFAQDFCLALKPRLTPMVAAWSGFITVATGSETIYKSQGNGTLQKSKDYEGKAPNPTHRGHKLQKFVKGKPRLVTTEARAALKIVYQYHASGVVTIDLAKWHDMGN